MLNNQKIIPMNLLDKMQQELSKIKKKLDSLHQKEKEIGIFGNGTMRKAKLEVNIEYYCREKFRLEGEIEALKEINQYKIHG